MEVSFTYSNLTVKMAEKSKAPDSRLTISHSTMGSGALIDKWRRGFEIPDSFLIFYISFFEFALALFFFPKNVEAIFETKPMHWTQ